MTTHPLDRLLRHGPAAVPPVANVGVGLLVTGLLHRLSEPDTLSVGGIDPVAAERVLIQLAVHEPAGFEGLPKSETSPVHGDVAVGLGTS